ncbi:MAG: hypothetical protein ACLQFR_02400 [Streptosporangiaceae bacterium]
MRYVLSLRAPILLTAVSTSAALALPLAGWQAVPSPDPGAANSSTFLDRVLAFSSSNAVGVYDRAAGIRTLIMHYTGGPL